MEAGVPFALFSGVQIVALAAAVGLACLGLGTRRGLPRVSLLAGGMLLVVAHALTGATLDGSVSWSFPALLRAVGYVVVALGLVSVPVTAPLVVAPLGAPLGPAALAAAAATLAGLAALTGRTRDKAVLAAAFALAAGSELLGSSARSSGAAAVSLLVLRLGSSVLLLWYVGRRAQRSLLAKVVAAILLGVVLLAVGAASSIGSLAARNLAMDQRDSIRQVGAGQFLALDAEVDEVSRVATRVGECLTRPDSELALSAEEQAARQAFRRQQCNAFVDAQTATAAFVFGTLERTPTGVVARDLRLYAGATSPAPLDRTSTEFLVRSPAVAEVVQTGYPVGTIEVVVGAEPRVLLLSIAPIGVTGPRAVASARGYVVYGVIVGDARLADIARQSGYDATLLLDGEVVATSLTAGDAATRAQVLAVYDSDAAGRISTREDAVTISAEGSRPTVHFQPVTNKRGDVVAVLALSASSSVVLDSQRDLLSNLFVVTLAVGALVGGLAYLLARRVVQPIRDLTLAASRVRRGDLTASAGVTSEDEVGVLSRTFDAMTASLSSSTEDLRQAAEDQSALAGRLETVLASMGDGLVIADGSGRVTGANRTAAELLGVEERALVGRPLTAVLVSADSGRPLVGERAQAEATTTIGSLARADGSRVPVALVQSPLRGDDGSVVVVRDTTRERQVERMKTEFLSNVSHELRTPLTPIRGYAEILARRRDLDPGQTERFAATILESSLRMARVVDLLVDVAALEAGRVEPQPVQTTVATIVDERLRAWRLREPGRTFRRRLASALPVVFVDREWVGKTLDELIDNAVKHCPDGAITLLASAHGSRVRLSVRDAGAGIPEDGLASLFSDFEQVDGSATRTVGGLGLGLSFVRRVADVMGFSVHVASAPGKGSTFSLDLPAARGGRPGKRPASARSRRGR